MQRICLFCGASPGASQAHLDAAHAFGEGVARRGMRLVYGAGDAGLMGAAARAARAAGGHVTGFIPQHLVSRELAYREIDSLVVTQTMHERKALMFTNSDAAAVLPGGVGTLDELVEIVTWRSLGLHDRPILLVDLDGFWQPFLELLRHMGRTGYLHAPVEEYLTVVPGIEAALDRLAAHG